MYWSNQPHFWLLLCRAKVIHIIDITYQHKLYPLQAYRATYVLRYVNIHLLPQSVNRQAGSFKLNWNSTFSYHYFYCVSLPRQSHEKNAVTCIDVVNSNLMVYSNLNVMIWRTVWKNETRKWLLSKVRLCPTVPLEARLKLVVGFL